jgi:hypothetical protein
MFGLRSDGKQLRKTSAIFKLMPNLMRERNDSQVLFSQDIITDGMDNYIKEKMEQNIKISYLDIVFAAINRIIAERPHLNRFCVNGRTYARNSIFISIVVKKSLSDESEETPLKIEFDGTENIFEVKDKLQAEISKNKKVETQNNTDKTVKALTSIPTFLIKIAMGIIRFLDKHGILPKFLIGVSPFHTSAFVTNVGSLGIDAIYHHLYNFGTTSMFFAMGRKKKTYVYVDDELVEKKCISIAFVGDERICDGYYYASSFKQLSKYLAKPYLLEEKGVKKIDEQL